MAWVDYTTIKQQVSIYEVALMFGVTLKQKTGVQYSGVCPFPEHGGDRDNPEAFQLNTERNIYNCQTHCGGGNVIDFYCLMQGWDKGEKFREAALFLQEKFLQNEAVGPAPKKKPASTESELEKLLKLSNPVLEFHLNTKKDIPFLLDTMGFEVKTLNHFDVGYCAKGMFRGRVVVPLHNEQGDLLGYAGRALTEKDAAARGEWMFPSGFHKMIELFNLHRVASKAKLRYDFGLIVVESFWSALKLHQYGYENVVALMGRALSPVQELKLLQQTDKICLFLDNDEPGRKATQEIARRLIRRAFVKIPVYPEGEDKDKPYKLSSAEIHHLLRRSEGQE